MKKIVLKLWNEKGTSEWIHFCYIDESLAEFMKGKDWISYIWGWAAKDFDKDFSLITEKDLRKLKRYINKAYKKKYPEFKTHKGRIDRYGYFRLWVTEHIKEEKRIGKNISS